MEDEVEIGESRLFLVANGQQVSTPGQLAIRQVKRVSWESTVDPSKKKEEDACEIVRVIA